MTPKGFEPKDMILTFHPEKQLLCYGAGSSRSWVRIGMMLVKSGQRKKDKTEIIDEIESRTEWTEDV